MAQKIISVAIIYDPIDKTLLLQHRDNKPEIFSPNKWGLFGGHGEENETPKQTLIRELDEELGIEVKEREIQLVNDYVWIHGNHHYVFLLNTTARAMQIELTEGQGFAWVSRDKALDYDLTVGAKNDLKIFLDSK